MATDSLSLSLSLDGPPETRSRRIGVVRWARLRNRRGLENGRSYPAGLVMHGAPPAGGGQETGKRRAGDRRDTEW